MGFKPRRSPPAATSFTLEDQVEFLNVDLELEGPADLAPLIDALGQVYVLHATKTAPFVANLEIEPRVGMDFDATMVALLDAVEQLDADARRLWDACTARRFDVGIQSGLAPPHTQYAVTTPILRRLGEMGAELVLTVYGARYESATAR